jgi:apolipoprotein D and lipocalin family protein
MPRLTAAAAALLALAACAAAPGAGFRDPAAPVYSIAAFDPARLPGTWTEAAAFAARGAPPCAAGFARIGTDLTASLRLCGSATAKGRLAMTGPGRLALAGAPAPLNQPLWVIWVDTDYRTLALGTPSGAFGSILVRGAPLTDDRLRAAAEVFDFSGYDIGQLRRLP